MMSIGQLAKLANVSNRTLRYYEELGLIAPKTRGENRYRYYDESHIQRINTIKMLQDGGFALKEIVAALVPPLDPSGKITYHGQEIAKKIFHALSEQRGRLLDRQKELDKTVDEIQKMMKNLHQCFDCKSSQALKDCAACERGPQEITGLSSQVNGFHLTANVSEAAHMRTANGN